MRKSSPNPRKRRGRANPRRSRSRADPRVILRETLCEWETTAMSFCVINSSGEKCDRMKQWYVIRGNVPVIPVLLTLEGRLSIKRSWRQRVEAFCKR